MPVFKAEGVSIRVPVGSFRGLHSPLIPPTNITILDVSLEKDIEFPIEIEAGSMCFIMPIAGSVKVNDEPYKKEDLRLPLFSARAEPQIVMLEALNEEAMFTVFIGRPLKST